MTEKTFSIIEDFHQAALAADLDYMIIGGFAASYWGTPRFTADVDFVIESKSFEKASRVASELGYSLAFLHPKQSFAHFVKTDQKGFRIDFMLVNENTWQTLFEELRLADLGGQQPYPIVSPLHLIAMKLHAAKQIDRTDSYKDLNDIAEILISQNITIDDLEISDILEKHGTEKTLSQLRIIWDSKRSR